MGMRHRNFVDADRPVASGARINKKIGKIGLRPGVITKITGPKPATIIHILSFRPAMERRSNLQ